MCRAVAAREPRQRSWAGGRGFGFDFEVGSGSGFGSGGWCAGPGGAEAGVSWVIGIDRARSRTWNRKVGLSAR